MFIAIDGYGNRVDIESAQYNQKYFCPVCKELLIIKDGEQKRKHFAHRSGKTKECDGWHYDMSDWHRNWQNQFPIECREIVVEKQGEKHRADVLINDEVVIEFQHSKLSMEEFEKRNRFYTSAGYVVIWLFDLTDDYEGKYAKRIEQNYAFPYIYRWKYHWSTFNRFNQSNDANINVFFQFASDLNGENKGIKKLINFSDDMKEFYTDHYMEYGWLYKEYEWNKNDFITLINEIHSENISNVDNASIPVHNSTNTVTPYIQSLFDIVRFTSDADRVIVKNTKTNYTFKIDLSKYRSKTIIPISGYDKSGMLKIIFYANEPQWIILKKRINGNWVSV